MRYNFTATNHGYPYEIRTLYSERYALGEWDECLYLENVTPDCEDHWRSFYPECPMGMATDVLAPLPPGTPVGYVDYTVGCLSSPQDTIDRCDSRPDSIKACTVTCEYCWSPYSLIFNVTAPADTYADCTLHMWYNKSGEYCKTLPIGERDFDCVTEPYTWIRVNKDQPFRVQPTESLTRFDLTNLTAPTQYLWNIHCISGSGHHTFAANNWTFLAECV